MPRPSPNPGGRPKAAVARDALLQLRTYEDLVERLDAMTLVRSRSSRANTIEYYLMRAVEADEASLGIGDAAMALPVEPPPSFESLSPRIRNAVLNVYTRLGRRKADGAEGRPKARTREQAQQAAKIGAEKRRKRNANEI